MTTTLQTRIDAKLKRDAKKALGSMGLDMSTGVKMFLTQVVRTQSIPFQVFTFDNLSSKKKQALIKDTQHALKHGKRYTTAEEAHRDILGK